MTKNPGNSDSGRTFPGILQILFRNQSALNVHSEDQYMVFHLSELSSAIFQATRHTVVRDHPETYSSPIPEKIMCHHG